MMGADLFLNRPLSPQRAMDRARFEHWVRVRTAAPSAAARRRAQEQVLQCFDALYGDGYFRDAYNRWNLLALFDLSWWRDVGGRVDAAGRLGPDQARWLWATLQAREPRLARNLARIDPRDGETKAEIAQYFRAKYARLQTLLRTAIEQEIAIDCAL